MVDFKYHVTSLVTIFLALGIGILIGSTMIGGDMIMEQQKTLIDQIEKDFHTLREQNRLAQEELMLAQSSTDMFRTYAYQILPQVIRGKLTGKKIAIISDINENLPEGLLENLQLAGASLPFVVQLADEKHLKLICSTIKELEQFDGAVILGQDHNSYLTNSLKENNQEIIIVVVETTSGSSYRKDIDHTNIWATIDNVDTIIGQTALVLAFIGESGHFGIKESAQQLLPRINQP